MLFQEKCIYLFLQKGVYIPGYDLCYNIFERNVNMKKILIVLRLFFKIIKISLQYSFFSKDKNLKEKIALVCEKHNAKLQIRFLILG